MTPDKQKQKLTGQSGIAQKVFQFVPIGEDWTPIQIAAALHQATGSRIDAHTLRGCLMTMVDAGLARVTASGTFQRAAVSSVWPPCRVSCAMPQAPAMCMSQSRAFGTPRLPCAPHVTQAPTAGMARACDGSCAASTNCKPSTRP